MTNSDFYIKKAKGKMFCEDYISYNDNAKRLLLTDGCSSSKDTHIGSAILNRLVNNNDKSYYLLTDKVFYSLKEYETKNLREVLDIDSTALDCTLVSLEDDITDYTINLFGDGVYFVLKDNILTFCEKEYPLNMPFYCSYHLDKSRLAQYKSFTDNTPILKIWEYNFISGEILNTTQHIIEEESPIVISKDNVSFIGITSDGLLSFLKNGNEEVPLKTIFNELCSFKNTNGEFLKRRMNRMIKNFSKEDIDNYDDFSIGVMYND